MSLVLVCLLGFAAAFLISCGGDRSRLIPKTGAAEIASAIDAVQAAVERGTAGCGAASGAADQARSAVRNLPDRTDKALRDRLFSGIRRLQDTAAGECRAQTGETVETIQTVTETTQPVPTTTQAPTPTITQPPPVTEPPATVPPELLPGTGTTPAPPETGGASPDATTDGTGGTP